MCAWKYLLNLEFTSAPYLSTPLKFSLMFLDPKKGTELGGTTSLTQQKPQPAGSA